MAQSSSSPTQKPPSPPMHANSAQPEGHSAPVQVDPPPIVRALTPDENIRLLPQELQRRIFTMLPRSAIPHVRLVCHTWRNLIDDMRPDSGLREDLIKLHKTSWDIYAGQFNVHLQKLVECHPALLNDALRDIAELLRHVHVEQRWACFTALMDCFPHLCSGAQRWLLCNLAVRVDSYQEGMAPGGSEKPGFVFAQAILDAASKQPMFAQALIVAALIDGMHIEDVTRSPLAETFGEMAGRWRHGLIDTEAWAAFLVCGLAGFLVRSDAQKSMGSVLRQFGYYRMPFPAAKDEVPSSPDASKPAAAGVDASALCESILQSELAWEEKRCLLMFHNENRFAMFEVPDEAARLFAILENLVNDTSTLVELIEVSDESGSTLLNQALSRIRLYPDYGWCMATELWLNIYAACIAASRKLPDDAKVRILRAGMHAPVAERKLHANRVSPSEDPRFGKLHDAPFHGVSAIDSLFWDSESYLLEAYMRLILNSPLSDDVKARVLRLDYPNRTGRPDMHAAHLLYCRIVRESTLRQDLKDSLLHGVMSDWRACSVM